METGRFSGMFPINRHTFIYLYCKRHFVLQPRGDVACWISWCSLNEDGTLNWGTHSRHLPSACFIDLFWRVTDRCSLASQEPVRIRECQSSEGYELSHLMTQDRSEETAEVLRICSCKRPSRKKGLVSRLAEQKDRENIPVSLRPS